MSDPTAAASSALPLLARIASHQGTALADDVRSVSYPDLLGEARRLAAHMTADAGDLRGERVIILVRASIDYVVGLLATWLVGAVATPIRVGAPDPEVAYVIGDVEPRLILTTDRDMAGVAGVIRDSRVATLLVDGPPDPAGTGALEQDDPSSDALILYTSGTTGRPKGVVHTHESLAAQMQMLVEAWEWRADDRILLSLPLHHVHGLVNVIGCALWSGARCDIHDTFDAGRVWEAFGELTLYMAVPTIYGRLADAWQAADEPTQQRWSGHASALRLMVSGSAALPVTTLERWQAITGHFLLERYGMTEIGMALSNRLEARSAGKVGWPLPTVETRVVDDAGAELRAGEAGELLVRGPAVFDRYWQRPDETRAAFLDGWFRTGDVVRVDPDGAFTILGRSSVDIIKSGGEKISALEIEGVFRTHPAVSDCAVVGVPDERWGERVCIAYVGNDHPATPTELRHWGKTQLSDYKVPHDYLCVGELPRNAMGKVIKGDVRALFGAGP